MSDFGSVQDTASSGLRMPRHSLRRRGNAKIKENAKGTIDEVAYVLLMSNDFNVKEDMFN